MAAVSSRRLVGREIEQEKIASVPASVRGGLSDALVLRGVAGIGKTALLDAAAESAADLRVVRLDGIESEMQLGFSALHQLLTPFLDGIETLAQAQRRALQTVFGLTDEEAPEQFMVGLATLTLLSDAAIKRGLLIIIDDAQWLDRESANVLSFVAQRVFADRIGVLIAVRDAGDPRNEFDALPSLVVEALPEGAALDLLDSCIQLPTADVVRSRILADAGGNPLAIVEMSRELSPSQRSGAEPLLGPLAVGAQLESRFLRQVRALALDTQRFLLIAAADATGDTELVVRAGRELNLDEDALGAAEAEGLVRLGSRLSFRHSLIRSAVYHGASEGERRRAHAALAAATDERDPDRRAWHRGSAALAPDEDVAGELEVAAYRIQGRGGYTATAALLARSATLTPEPRRRAFRWFTAAIAHLTAGNTTRAHESLALAAPDLGDPLLEAHARQLEAGILFIDTAFDRSRAGLGRREDIVALMLDAASTLAQMDRRVARETVLDALQMAVYFGTLSATPVEQVARAAQSLTLPSDVEPTPVDLVLDALAVLFGGKLVATYPAAAPLLRAGLAAMRADPEMQNLPRRIGFGCWAGLALSDDDGMQSLAGEWAATCRERGAFLVLPEALAYLGMSELRLGSLDAAEAHFTEQRELHALYGRTGTDESFQLVVTAWRGEEAEFRATASVLGTEARELGLGYLVAAIEHAMAVLELGLGNYAAAAAAQPDFAHDPPMGPFSAVDAIEAHVRSGDRAVAVGALEWLTARATANESALDHGLAARGRALLSDDSLAETHFQESLAQLERSRTKLHLARTQLVYGEWLRRQKRRRDARAQLEAALDTFESVGAAAFAERTRVELAATGAVARKRVDETRHRLTPQETQIAKLATGGATNSEIATRLLISANTVDYHLRKIYRKLDIRSRRELARTDVAVHVHVSPQSVRSAR